MSERILIHGLSRLKLRNNETHNDDDAYDGGDDDEEDDGNDTDDGDANVGELPGVPRTDPVTLLVPLFVSAVLMALRIPTLSVCRAMLSGRGSVVSMGMSLTTTAWLLMPRRSGPSFQMSRAYALVSRVSKYMSQNEHAHVSAIATQKTAGFDAASSVNRRMPLVLFAKSDDA